MADLSPECASATKNWKHRRAGRACLSCRARKVRCDVVEQSPCRNCERDMLRCIVPRNRRSRKVRSELYDNSGDKASPQTIFCDADDARVLEIASRHDPAKRHTPAATSRPSVEKVSRPPDTDGLSLPAYIKPIETKDDSTLRFLKEQHVFTLPSVQMQFELLRAYIEFSYPRMPVIHLEAFCQAIESCDGSGGKISIMLYQAVLFAGAAHVRSSVAEENGWASKKTLRRELHQRVELLYELLPEDDDLVKVQVALLLTSKCVSKTDKKDSWHWVNAAITMAMFIGLHQERKSPSTQTDEDGLRRRVWWCCYVRDKIVALGLGRPTRIKSFDFEVPMLQIKDVELTVLGTRRVLLDHDHIGPHDQASELQSAELLIEKTKLSILIESILHHVADNSVMSAENCNSLDMALKSWCVALPASCHPQPLKPGRQMEAITLSNHLRQHLLHMVYYTAVYTLHRPRVLPQSPHQISTLTTTAQEREASRARLRESADNITRLAAEIHRQKLDYNLPLTAITVICPAIFMHLLNMKSGIQARREAAVLSFRVCMRTMEKLQELYTCTDATISYLEHVLRSAAITGLPWIDNSIPDIFRLNQTDRSDLLAILGRNSLSKSREQPGPSQGAMGLSGLDSLLDPGVACDWEVDADTTRGSAFPMRSPDSGMHWLNLDSDETGVDWVTDWRQTPSTPQKMFDASDPCFFDLDLASMRFDMDPLLL